MTEVIYNLQPNDFQDTLSKWDLANRETYYNCPKFLHTYCLLFFVHTRLHMYYNEYLLKNTELQTIERMWRHITKLLTGFLHVQIMHKSQFQKTIATAAFIQALRQKLVKPASDTYLEYFCDISNITKEYYAKLFLQNFSFLSPYRYFALNTC